MLLALEERRNAATRLRAARRELLRPRALDDVEKERLKRLARRFDRFDSDALRRMKRLLNRLDRCVIKPRGSNQRVLGIRQQLVARASGAHTPAIQNHHSIAHILDIGKKVRGQKDRLPTSTELQDEILHLPRSERVEA